MLHGKNLVLALATIIGPTVCIAMACAWPDSGLRSGSDSRVEVVGFELRDGSDPVVLADNCRNDVSITLLDLLRKEGMVGSLHCGGTGSWRTRAPHGRVIVILTHQVSAPVDLPLPVGEVVYLQIEGGWASYPVDAETTDEYLRLYPDPESPDWATLFSVTDSRGNRSGATLVTWGKVPQLAPPPN